MGLFHAGSDDDDTYITSAFCDRDEVQWLYFRRVSRGFSDLEKVECECCGDKLFVNEKRGSFVSSTITPEVVGWLRAGSNKTLDLVLTESSCETLRDVLLSDIRSHEFSGSISKVRLLQTPSALRKDLLRGISEPESFLKLIEQHAVISRKRKRRKKLRLKGDDLSESPFHPKESLSDKDLASMKRFLRNPQAEDYKWSTTKSFSDDSESFRTSRTKLPILPSSGPSSFDTWTPPVKGLKLTPSKFGTKRKRNTSTSAAISLSDLNLTVCRKGT